jgi:hypothetical protein
LDHGRGSISVGDIYVTADHKHCGLVVRTEESRDPAGKIKITIRNDSSSSSGGRGVVDDDFDNRFHGRGEFKW